VFISEFAKLQKVTICFVMSVSLSIYPEQLSFHWTDFFLNLVLEDFFKLCQENSSFIKF